MTGDLEKSLEEWMEQYRLPEGIEELGRVFFGEDTHDEFVATNTRRIIAWWQQEDKPFKFNFGLDAKKNANEVALEAILKLFTVGTSELSDEEFKKRY